jgi:predicted NBD/HSP70 family sugar kinase
MASGFDAVLDPAQLKEFGVGQKTVADVLARVVMAAPDAVPRVDIAKGPMLPGLAELPQGSVSRAASLLLKLGLLTEEDRRVERPGRPIIPLRLGSKWIMVGVSIRHRGGRPVEVAGVVTALDGTLRDKSKKENLSGSEDHEVLVKIVADMVRRLIKDEQRRVLGVGVELGGHVHQGTVILVPSSAANRWPVFPLGEMLSKELSGLPTVVENDVNARAVREIWKKDPDSHELRFPQPHFAVVAVLEEGVGGALVIDRKIYRGGCGMAGEIGHLTVDYSRPHGRRPSGPGNAESGSRGFDDPCPCADTAATPARIAGRGYGHVDALATPARIAGELGIQFQQAAQEPGTGPGGNQTRAGKAFAAAGEALGRGIAAMLNITNPASLLLLLPPELTRPAEGTAAAEYLRAVERALDKDCFSSAAADARAGRATLLAEPADPSDAFEGAQAAATCVLDSFIAHARGEETESLAEVPQASTA